MYYIGIDKYDLDRPDGFGVALVYTLLPNDSYVIVDELKVQGKSDFESKLILLKEKYKPHVIGVWQD